MRISALTFCTLLATTALANPAYGQAYSAQARQFPDENGVDVVTGKANIPGGSVSIGRPGDSGMAYTYGWKGGVYTDTFDLTMYNQPFDGSQPVAFTIFGQQKRFNYVGGAWQSFDGDGSTFVEDTGINGFRYTTRDGTVFTFLKSLADSGWNAQVAARVSTITFPSGEVWTYTYSIHPGENIPTFPEPTIYPAMGRVQSVNSNLGYQLKPSYFTNSFFTDGSSNQNWIKLTKVTAINNAVDYCSPSADTCSGFTQTWPVLNVSQSTTPGVLTYNFTDQMSRSTLIGTTVNVGTPLSVQSPGNASADTGIAYDAALRVTTVSKSGGSWGYSYVDSGTVRTTTVTQPIGGSKIYVVDLTKNLLTSVTDELSRTTSFLYDSFGRQTRATAPEGNYVENTYDARGNVTQQLAKSKTTNPTPDIVVSASFDSSCANQKTCNKPNSVTDARGNTTTYAYDSTHGGVTTVTGPEPTSGANQPQTRFGYTSLSAYYKNSSGTIVAAPTPVYKLTSVSACQTEESCIGGANEVKSVITRGTTGVANNLLPTAIASGSGDGALTATSAFTNDPFGNVTAVDGPLTGTADTTTYTYNATRQLTKITTPDPDGGGPLAARVYNTSYGSNGQRDAVYMTTSGPRQEFAYDNLGRLIKQSWKSGPNMARLTHAVSQYSYDTKGRLQCSVVRMNSATFASPPASACTAATTGSQGPDRISQLVYDNADQVTKQQVAVGTAAAADALTLTYTANGLMQTLKDGENNLTTYKYDSQDRLSRTEYPNTTKGSGTSNTSDYEELTYENTTGTFGTRTSGTVASVRLRNPADPSSAPTIAFTYDALGRLKMKDLPGSEGDITYSYDLLNRTTGVSQSGYNLTFGYDALSRQTYDGQGWGNIARSFDLAGRLTRTTWWDGFYVDYDRLVTGEISKVRENGLTTGAGVLATFAYNALGQRTSNTRGNGTTTAYIYDGIGRLTSVANDLASTASDLTINAIAYNPASQIVSQVRSNDAYAWTGHGNGSTATVTDGLNRLVTVGGTSATFDGKGNLTTDPVISKTYGYTAQNELASASGGSGATVYYDPIGRLAEYDTTVSTRFMSDGVQLTVEIDNPAGAIQKRWVWGDGPDELLVEYVGASNMTRRWAHADERGSIVALSDGSGNAAATYRYDEYGRPQDNSTRSMQYTGQLWLPETGMYHYKLRNYGAHLGRFSQTDPMGYAPGPNLYAYVSADPVNFIDPMGLYPVCETVAPGYTITSPEGDTIVGAKISCIENGQPLPGGEILGINIGPIYEGGGGSGETPEERRERLVQEERRRVADNAYCGSIRAGALVEGALAGFGLGFLASAIDNYESGARPRTNIRNIGSAALSRGNLVTAVIGSIYTVAGATENNPRCGQGSLD